jgi:16S rRNA pseudouridine516 synthase
MFQAVGKKVIYLKRISFGGLSLPADLELGKSRPLSREELYLLNLVF